MSIDPLVSALANVSPVRDGPSRAPVPSSGGSAASSSPTPVVSREQLEQALRSVRQNAQLDSALVFRTNEETGRTVIQIVDRATNEVLRQIPSEEMVAIAQALDQQSTQGLLLKRTA